MNATRPLAGRRVVLTRATHQAGPLRASLEGLGAEVIEAPAIEIAPPRDPTGLAQALADLVGYDWVAFTSANAVHAVRRGLAARGPGAWPEGPRIASVGEATSEAVVEAFGGRRPDLEAAGDSSAQGLLRAFAGTPVGRVLLPVSDRARPDLASGLKVLGIAVDVVVAYENRVAPDLGARLSQALEGGVDLVLLASPSAAEAVAQAAGPRSQGLPCVAIGETTRKAAENVGLAVLGTAETPGPEGMARAALAALSRPRAIHPSP